MTTSEYARCIDWNGLEKILVEKNISFNDLNRNGILYGARNQLENSPTLLTLLRLSAFFDVGINELITFRGIEVKDRFKKSPYERRSRREYVELSVSYGPLRCLFFDTYGNNWKTKLNEYFDKVERPDVSEALIRNGKELANRLHGIDREPKAVNPNTLSAKIKYNLKNDKEVSIGVLYELCKTLRCTPDWIVTYK